MDINELLRMAVEKDASDIHISAGESPMIRIDGDLSRLDFPVVEKAESFEIAKSMMNDLQKAYYEEELEIDFSYEIEGVSRFRVNAFNQNRGAGITVRLIPYETPTLSDMGLHESIFREVCNFKNGLVLMTGPTGSGKSTTLAAMVDYINRESNKKHHIITIEDPIEYVFKNHNCLIQQREAGQHTKSFHNAMRSALREDPDIIMVAEMRDLETIRLALTAAETGHLVFSTLHTNSASKSIYRIVDAFPSGEKALIRSMLAECLRAVIAQTLVKRPEGGRLAVTEIMLCNPAIRNLIREDKIAQIYSAIQTGQSMGMRTFEQHLEQLIQADLIIPPDGVDIIAK